MQSSLFLLCEEERKTKNPKEFLQNFRKRIMDIILEYYCCLTCLCHNFVIQNNKPICVKTKQGFQSKKVSFIHYSFSLAEILAIRGSRSFCDLKRNVKPELVYWSLNKDLLCMWKINIYKITCAVVQTADLAQNT